MPATAGSIYQALRLQHIAGSPPNTDPQRSNESFETYVLRMSANSLPPDIGATESDSDYLTRLATYNDPLPFYDISASYANYAKSEISPSPTSSYALRSGTVVALTTAATYPVTASYAVNSVNSAPSSTASYLEGGKAVLSGITGDNITITNTSGRGLYVTTTTTGNAIYAQSLTSQAVWGVQAKVTPLAADINVGAIAAYRSIFDTGSFNVVAAAVTAGNQYDVAKAPLYSGEHAGVEVFKVDWSGSISVNGVKGYSGVVNVAAGVTMSFHGGIMTGVTS